MKTELFQNPIKKEPGMQIHTAKESVPRRAAAHMSAPLNMLDKVQVKFCSREVRLQRERK